MTNGQLRGRYDQKDDILYVDKCLFSEEQESDEIGDEIIARFNPDSGAVENLEVLFSSKRLMASKTV